MTDESDPHDRIRRALLSLNAAPDVDPAKATRAEVAALHAANLAAWVVLTEGDVLPSRRDGRFGPVHEEEKRHDR